MSAQDCRCFFKASVPENFELFKGLVFIPSELRDTLGTVIIYACPYSHSNIQPTLQSGCYMTPKHLNPRENGGKLEGEENNNEKNM
jgi:hypothetical protein